MPGGKAGGCLLALLVGLVLLVIGALFGITGALAVNVEEQRLTVPPELEAVYKQAAVETGVPWTALAAWDAAQFRFLLPIPTIEQVFAERVQDVREARLRVAEQWCGAHPEDRTRCPPPEPEITPDDETRIWRGALDAWRQIRKTHVERHAIALKPFVSDLEKMPATVFGRLMPKGDAVRAEDLFEGYLILESLEQEQDEILIDLPAMPEDWTPVHGFAWPVAGPLTSRYGMRFSPLDGVLRLHAGIDLSVSTGAPVRATKAGRVTRAEFDGTYGLVVVVEHGEGYRSLYAHNSHLNVAVGQTVAQGEIIAAAGSTGRSTGPHSHFEIHYRGTPVDPLLVLTKTASGSAGHRPG